MHLLAETVDFGEERCTCNSETIEHEMHLCDFRGLVYARNPDIGPGFIAVGGNGTLVYRPCLFDQYNQMETDDFAQIISASTIEVLAQNVMILINLQYSACVSQNMPAIFAILKSTCKYLFLKQE